MGRPLLRVSCGLSVEAPGGRGRVRQTYGLGASRRLACSADYLVGRAGRCVSGGLRRTRACECACVRMRACHVPVRAIAPLEIESEFKIEIRIDVGNETRRRRRKRSRHLKRIRSENRKRRFESECEFGTEIKSYLKMGWCKTGRSFQMIIYISCLSTLFSGGGGSCRRQGKSAAPRGRRGSDGGDTVS